MTKYIIYSKYLSNGFECDIDKDTYNNLKQSKEVLFEVRSKENIYNIVLMNYYEFENELFEISLKCEVFSHYEFNDHVSKIEQRILNLLSSSTLYLDSFKNDLQKKGIEKYSSHLEVEFEKVRAIINNDSKFRIMKHIRNHIQHNGLIVDNISVGGENISKELREQTIKFHVSKNKIKARDFKVDDFLNIESNVDLKKAIRGYIDFLSSVHHSFREATNEKVENARNCFEEILNKYQDYKFLYVAKKESDADEVAILLDWDNVRIELRNKNRVPTHFERHSINTK